MAGEGHGGRHVVAGRVQEKRMIYGVSVESRDKGNNAKGSSLLLI